MKISKKQAEMVLARAMSTGADYAEIFAEYTTNRSIQMLSGKVEEDCRRTDFRCERARI